MRIFWIQLFVYVFVLHANVQALTVSNYSNATNNRFANDASFIGASFDWSGVGRSSSGRWATLIGDNYFISANHFHPGVGSTISFVDGNSVSDATYNYTVAGGFQVGSTDLWIGYTNESINSSLARYSYSTTAANTLAQTGLSNTTLYMVGDQVAGTAGTVTDQVVGTNQAESFRETGTTLMNTPHWSVNFSSAAGFDQLTTFDNEVGDNTLTKTTYEAQLQDGDSGSPLFSVLNNSLVLQGIGFAVSAGANSIPGDFVDTQGFALENRDASYYSYVGAYESGIQSAIAQVPTAVPEPSAIGLLGLSAFCVLIRRRR